MISGSRAVFSIPIARSTLRPSLANTSQPNWGEQPATDRLEEAWILVLDAPACVMADHTNQNNDQPEFNVIVMQLVVTDTGPHNEYLKQVENLVGRRVTVTGALEHAVTGDNRTPVMLIVASIAST